MPRSSALRKPAAPAVSLLPPLSRHLPRQRGPLIFCRALRARGANLLQTCHLRGLPGPGPRVTFWPARKSPKSRLREGGFRFPPSLKNPFPLKRPRPGACGPPPWIQPPGRGAGVRVSIASASFMRAAAEREGQAILVCTKLAPDLLPCTRTSCRSTGPSWSAPQPSSSPTPCTALLFFSARRRRGGGCISDKPASHCLVSKKVKS